jgi:hypothetical protein
LSTKKTVGKQIVKPLFHHSIIPVVSAANLSSKPLLSILNPPESTANFLEPGGDGCELRGKKL